MSVHVWFLGFFRSHLIMFYTYFQNDIKLWKKKACIVLIIRTRVSLCGGLHSDSFTIFGLWVLGLAVIHINGSNCKLMSPEHYFSWQVCNTIAFWDSLKSKLCIAETKVWVKDAGWAGKKFTGTYKYFPLLQHVFQVSYNKFRVYSRIRKPGGFFCWKANILLKFLYFLFFVYIIISPSFLKLGGIFQKLGGLPLPRINPVNLSNHTNLLCE